MTITFDSFVVLASVQYTEVPCQLKLNLSDLSRQIDSNDCSKEQSILFLVSLNHACSVQIYKYVVYLNIQAF
jgi:hypothetical protein